MNTKLKFVIRKEQNKRLVNAYLVVPNAVSEIEGDYKNSYINISDNVLELFEFATDFSLQNNISLKKERTKNRNKIKDTIIFDKGNFIINNFNKEISVLNPTLENVSLKRKLIKGLAVGLTSALVTTGVINLLSDSNSNDKVENNSISLTSDDDIGYAGIAKVLNNFDTDGIEVLLDEDEMEIMQNDAQKNIFKFNYEDCSNSEQVFNAKQNIDVFNKYGKMYGIDPNLLMAMMAQESGGIHHSYSDNGSAIGGMQIESIWDQVELSAFNFDTNSVETINVDINQLSDLNYNVKVAAMILQFNLVKFDYDIPKSVQAYNMGTYKISGYGQTWVNDRANSKTGDPKYFEHVFSYLPDGYTINIKRPDGLVSSITLDNSLSNDYKSSLSMN